MKFLNKISEYKYLYDDLTIVKISNATKLYYQYRKSVNQGKSQLTAYPIAISVEPTTACNLQCPQCISGLRAFTRSTGTMDLKLFNSIITQLSPYLMYNTLYFQGEPMLNKSIFDMINLASENNIYTSTSTNGHYLSDEACTLLINSGLQKIIISVDGANSLSYSKYRIGGDFDKVKEGIAQLVSKKQQLRKSNPIIVMQFVVFNHNENEIEDIKKLAKKLKVDRLEIKTAQVYDYQTDSEWIPNKVELSRYQKDANNIYQIKNDHLNKCWRMWQSAVITWDGKVVPCCFDKDAHHSMGNLNNNSFEEIWFSDKYNDFRNQILRSRKSINICTNCTEGMKK
ncbi:MAG: radical SAM/SPASM domain-containing protein [Bacteroidota bacterium]|nr:radical SAM/SPASM domain-containing protein [Bacteroidota bacterium]